MAQAATNEQSRICPKCRREKPIDQFYRRTLTHRVVACRQCHRAAVANRKKRLKEAHS
jgi:ssDNA-binding Zn-finger/Zn-ribbon topoisomerase 1